MIKHKKNIIINNPPKIKTFSPMVIEGLNPYSLLADRVNNLTIINGPQKIKPNNQVIKSKFQAITESRKPEQFAMTNGEVALFKQLTTLQNDLPNVGSFKRGDLFIHWLYPNRGNDKLYACEIFHINMLRYFGIPNGMTTIHIRCACSYKEPTQAMKQAVELLSGSAEIDFKLVENKENWEHDTIQEATEYAIETGKFVYYTHFKGSSRMAPVKEDRRKPICTLIDVLYWCYLMYRGLFTEQSVNMDAIGPIVYYGINNEYIKLNHPQIHPRYQYIGSFQAFDGSALKKRFNDIGLGTIEERNKYIWDVSTGRYAVEMFLCLAFEEQQVHSIVQLPKKKAAYRMYRDGLFEPLLKEFKDPYKPLNRIFNNNNKVAVCCIAKNEDDYADEWLNHYRKLGVSHFYWIDNNPYKTEKIKQLEKCNDVTIINANGKDTLKAMGYQYGAYQLVYDKYSNDYGWIGFLDLDEFVELDDFATLPELLSQPMFAGTTSVSMHWRYFGDNGLVKYDNRPLKVRFKDPAPIDVKYAADFEENRYIKSFVRTGLPIETGIHTSKFYGALNKLANGRLREPYEDIGEIDLKGAHINHYGTKTIEEYIKRKCLNTDRATGLKSISNKDRLDWFFNVNKVTPEKLEVINTMLPNLHYKPKKNLAHNKKARRTDCAFYNTFRSSGFLRLY